jgi:hypothetical protein
MGSMGQELKGAPELMAPNAAGTHPFDTPRALLVTTVVAVVYLPLHPDAVAVAVEEVYA